MALPQHLLLDLATDPASTSTNQLLAAARERCPPEFWSQRVTILSRQNPLEDTPTCPWAFVLCDCNAGLLFKAKSLLDNEGRHDFTLVTTLVMKKFWERMCLSLCSHVHTWSVVGIDVKGQALDVEIPEEATVDIQIRDFLKTVGCPDDVEVLRCVGIPTEMFNAGFSTRKGGVSTLNSIASLNLRYTIRKPDPEPVIQENMRRFREKAGIDTEDIIVARIEHGTTIRVVGKDRPIPNRYDGVATDVPGVVVAAPGADCCLIMMADTRTGACGAVHAGWAGTVKGAVPALLRTLVSEYGTSPQDVKVAFGPCVEAECYTVSKETIAKLLGHGLDPDLAWPSKTKPNSFHLDLNGVNAAWLAREGVKRDNMDLTWDVCTVCHPDRFYSHARDNIPFGTQIGFISRRSNKS